jgi:glutamate formiminotransferase/glutamate formiminotransferase/formiminotetrahydrofolate cyclodeaminase
MAARDSFAIWAGATLELPCFLYGPERSLPEVRRQAWDTLMPDHGPGIPHRTAGAAAVGARPVLVAYNLWLAEPDLPAARAIAGALRSPQVRALALQVGDHIQVSCNLIDPWAFGPEAAFDAVASRAGVARAELVGLAPAGVLAGAPRHRWPELDLDPSTTIEARLEQAGLDGGRFAAHAD